MKKYLPILLVIFVLSGMVLAACGGGAAKEVAVPSAYAGKTNPLGADAAAAGKVTFDERCASCHGATGAGDGAASAGLDPKPANLATEGKTLGDDFLFWRISEGGGMEPFNSSMPAWKGILTEEQIWQLVSYIKSL
jgi:mono/diheme cytochrome c family protein